MKLISYALIVFALPVLTYALDNPAKLYTNMYDGRFSNIGNDGYHVGVGNWNLSFFRKDSDVVSLDWNTKKETTYKCNLPKEKFAVYQFSKENSVYFIVQEAQLSEGWILNSQGECFKLSGLVNDFPSDDIRRRVFYSEKIKQLVITSRDYKIAPRDGLINIFINPQTKAITQKVAGNFSPGLWAVQSQNIAVSKSGQGRYLNFYNTETFTLDKTVDFGKSYISEVYLKESSQLGLGDSYLLSGRDQNGTFFGYYDKTAEKITKRFSTGCFQLKFSIENNLALCYDTPPGGPWDYYTQDLTTGETTLLWNDLWHEPILSTKNSMIIANKQNGLFSFYNIQTKQKTEVYTEANANNFFFLDKDEKYIISVSNNWSGVVEVEKFLIADPSKTTLLYKLEIPNGDDYTYTIFNAEKSKLYIPLIKGGAYYLDIK